MTWLDSGRLERRSVSIEPHIRPALEADAPHLARLIVDGLQTRFQLLGMGFVTLLHRHMADSPHAVCVTAEDAGRVVGYACALTSVRGFFRDFALRRAWLAVVLSAPRLFRPATLRVVWHSLQYPTVATPSDPPAELVSVVVVPEARGQGIARRMVETIGGEMARRGIAAITIKTESTNVAAKSLYTKMGCRAVRQEPFAGGVELTVYVWDLPEAERSS